MDEHIGLGIRKNMFWEKWRSNGLMIGELRHSGIIFQLSPTLILVRAVFPNLTVLYIFENPEGDHVNWLPLRELHEQPHV